MQVFLETDRLLIRPINEGDKVFMFDLMNSDGWLKFIGDRNIKSMQDSLSYIQKIIANPDYFYSIVILKENNHPVGLVSFLRRPDFEYPDIGFAFLSDYQQMGLGYEASNAYLEKLREKRLWNRILGITKPNNFKSVCLLERLGFRFKETTNSYGQDQAIYELNL